PEGLILAVDDADGRVAGFALVGFAPNEDLSALSHDEGVICAVIVRPSHRRKGIGRDLVRRCEEYAAARGAKRFRAGAILPQCPFGFALYGGTGSPGSLASDTTGA